MSNGLFVQVSEEVLRTGHPVRFTARGNSMHPTIRDSEEIVVIPADPARVRRGDIVLFRTPRGVLAHRVVRIRDTGGEREFVLRGDALQGCDEPITAAQVLGLVVTVTGGGRDRKLRGGAARVRQFLARAVSRLRGIIQASAPPADAS